MTYSLSLSVWVRVGACAGRVLDNCRGLIFQNAGENKTDAITVKTCMEFFSSYLLKMVCFL